MKRRKSAQSNYNKLVATPPSTPLTTFQLFPKLPIEIRLRIYRLAAHEPRLIELEHLNGYFSHYGYQVARQSRQAPALLQLCRESREEGIHFYEKRNFQAPGLEYPSVPIQDDDYRPYIWYSPHVDIILFGKNTCLNTMRLVVSEHRPYHVIPRVAFLISGNSCCGTCPTKVLEALHGGALYNWRDGDSSGCKGLLELFIVVQSNLFLQETALVTDLVDFRPVSSFGRTKVESDAYREYRSHIAGCENGMGVWSKWLGGNMPKIEFVSLAPKAVDNDPRGYDGVVVSAAAARKLRNQYHLHTLEVTSGCEIYLPNEEVDQEDSVEVGFWGTQRQIEAAKGVIGD